jgi:bifunctional UDP-N-acetylglucosamine pyrophosphorylase/glucosamine-1-phosphate N-acetyltransferase
MILNGDTPLIKPGTLRAFYDFHRENGCSATVMSTMMDDPFGYGRIVRGEEGLLERIVEERDAEESEKGIREINGGIFCVDGPVLFEALSSLERSNSQSEYYLTDIIEILNGLGKKTDAFLCENNVEVLGINTISQLEEAERLITDG